MNNLVLAIAKVYPLSFRTTRNTKTHQGHTQNTQPTNNRPQERTQVHRPTTYISTQRFQTQPHQVQ